MTNEAIVVSMYLDTGTSYNKQHHNDTWGPIMEANLFAKEEKCTF